MPSGSAGTVAARGEQEHRTQPRQQLCPSLIERDPLTRGGGT